MKNNKTEYFPIHILREDLRQQASSQAVRLSRWVGRLTSCDSLPCLEYGQEVQAEYTLAQRLFYLQHCRNALERCIAGGSSMLRYRWLDGTVTKTSFKRVGPGRVRVTGLLLEGPAQQGPAA
jgi:hypothetical protein